MPRVYVKTFGCQMNEYDSARMADVLRAFGGYEPTDDPRLIDWKANRVSGLIPVECT